MTINAFAKVNIFLKITGTRENYHELASRFMRVASLCDTLSFEPKDEPSSEFILEGAFGCSTEKNTIYKAYLLLNTYNQSGSVTEFFKTHKVVVEKHIPEFAGLGGGSSDAAAFLRLCNKVLKLNIDTDTLAEIGAKIGADVPFFVYDYPSANVKGIGEIVEAFDEELLTIETFTPKVACDTKAVYTQFRQKYLQNIDNTLAQTLLKMPSKEILRQFNAKELNDLFPPCLDLYKDLNAYHKEGWFFSGSGSTFFRMTDG